MNMNPPSPPTDRVDLSGETAIPNACEPSDQAPEALNWLLAARVQELMLPPQSSLTTWSLSIQTTRLAVTVVATNDCKRFPFGSRNLSIPPVLVTAISVPSGEYAASFMSGPKRGIENTDEPSETFQTPPAPAPA